MSRASKIHPQRLTSPRDENGNPPFIFIAPVRETYFWGGSTQCHFSAKGKEMPAYFRLAAAACFLLGNCAGPAFKMMPEYNTMTVEKSRLGIILLRDNLTVRIGDGAGGDSGGGKVKQGFCDFFTSQLRGFALKDGKFAGVEAPGGFDTSLLVKSTEFVSPDKPVSVRVPGRRAFVGDSVQFLLILDSISVSKEYQPGLTMTTPGANGMTTPAGGSESLVLRGAFALWDNLEGKPAAFGRIEETSGVFTAMTKNTWAALVKNVSSGIFLGKPYGQRTAAPGE
jgi:hypothetical protein